MLINLSTWYTHRALGQGLCQDKVQAPSALELYWISTAKASLKTPLQGSGHCQGFPVSHGRILPGHLAPRFLYQLVKQCQVLLPESSLKVCSDADRSNQSMGSVYSFAFFFLFANENQKCKCSIPIERDCIKNHTFCPHTQLPCTFIGFNHTGFLGFLPCQVCQWESALLVCLAPGHLSDENWMDSLGWVIQTFVACTLQCDSSCPSYWFLPRKWEKTLTLCVLTRDVRAVI